jgi:hypothetical protein
MNFYTFYNIQAKHTREEESFCKENPGKIQNLIDMPSAPKNLHTTAPGGGGELAPGDVGSRRATSGPGLRLGLPSIEVLGSDGEVVGER